MSERLFKRGEVYWVNLPDKGGHELKDRHMGVIISNNRQNLASSLIIILPITSKVDKLYSFEVETFINNQKGKILIDQITTTDKVKRIENFVGKLDEKMLLKIERTIFYVLAISTEALEEELEARKKKNN